MTDKPEKLTIAITGAGGTIGRATVRMALQEGHNVVALDITPTEPDLGDVKPKEDQYVYKHVDLLDFDAFVDAIEGCNALIHLAAVYSLVNPEDPEGPMMRFEPEWRIHNHNTTMSWNALLAAADLGINRVAIASSVNAVGMLFSKPRPRFDYLPLDEKHPLYPQDAYSICKEVVEVQAAGFSRRYPHMRIASLRPHWVIPESLAYDPKKLHAAGGNWRDLWGWVSDTATARAFLLALTAPTSTFPLGHEAFFIMAPTICQQTPTLDLIREKYPEIKDIHRKNWTGNQACFDTSKAEKMLGWTEKEFIWEPK